MSKWESVFAAQKELRSWGRRLTKWDREVFEREEAADRREEKLNKREKEIAEWETKQQKRAAYVETKVSVWRNWHESQRYIRMEVGFHNAVATKFASMRLHDFNKIVG